VRPSQQMTGFGIAAPSEPAPAAAPAGPTGPTIQHNVAEFEGSIDDRLAALING